MWTVQSSFIQFGASISLKGTPLDSKTFKKVKGTKGHPRRIDSRSQNSDFQTWWRFSKLANYNYHHLSFSLPPSSPPPLPCSPTPPSAPASLRRGRFWRGSPAGVLQMVPKLHLHYPPTSQPHLHCSLRIPPPLPFLSTSPHHLLHPATPHSEEKNHVCTL